MGRSSGPKKVSLIFRIREELLAELYLKRPELQRSDGHTKYGAITSYFERLVREDLDRGASAQFIADNGLDDGDDD